MEDEIFLKLLKKDASLDKNRKIHKILLPQNTPLDNSFCLIKILRIINVLFLLRLLDRG